MNESLMRRYEIKMYAVYLGSYILQGIRKIARLDIKDLCVENPYGIRFMDTNVLLYVSTEQNYVTIYMDVHL